MDNWLIWPSVTWTDGPISRRVKTPRKNREHGMMHIVFGDVVVMQPVELYQIAIYVIPEIKGAFDAGNGSYITY